MPICCLLQYTGLGFFFQLKEEKTVQVNPQMRLKKKKNKSSKF